MQFRKEVDTFQQWELSNGPSFVEQHSRSFDVEGRQDKEKELTLAKCEEL